MRRLITARAGRIIHAHSGNRVLRAVACQGFIVTGTQMLRTCAHTCVDKQTGVTHHGAGGDEQRHIAVLDHDRAVVRDHS
jgi:hypothetical protein